jgi:hypothetical protein
MVFSIDQGDQFGSNRGYPVALRYSGIADTGPDSAAYWYSVAVLESNLPPDVSEFDPLHG